MTNIIEFVRINVSIPAKRLNTDTYTYMCCSSFVWFSFEKKDNGCEVFKYETEKRLSPLMSLGAQLSFSINLTIIQKGKFWGHQRSMKVSHLISNSLGHNCYEMLKISFYMQNAYLIKVGANLGFMSRRSIEVKSWYERPYGPEQRKSLSPLIFFKIGGRVLNIKEEL